MYPTHTKPGRTIWSSESGKYDICRTNRGFGEASGVVSACVYIRTATRITSTNSDSSPLDADEATLVAGQGLLKYPILDNN